MTQPIRDWLNSNAQWKGLVLYVEADAATKAFDALFATLDVLDTWTRVWPEGDNGQNTTRLVREIRAAIAQQIGVDI